MLEWTRHRLRDVAVVVLILVAVGCHSSEAPGQHWTQNTGGLERRINLYVLATEPYEFKVAINAGVAQADRSPYIDVTAHAVTTLPATCGGHCITAVRRPMNGASAVVGWDTHLHMHGLAARLAFDSAPWPPAVLANATCHELFHALGLDHSGDGTPGPCQNGQATSHDLAGVNRVHAHTDPTPLGPLTFRVVDETTRAEFEAMAE